MCGRSCGPEDERDPERYRRDRIVDQSAWSKNRLVLRMKPHGLLEKPLQAETESPEDADRHDHGPRQQQDRLDHLHPACREHAAEHDVEHHQDTDDADRGRIREAKEQLDELSGAHHLRNQIEEHDHQRARAREQPNRLFVEPVGQNISERVMAEIAERLRDQEQDHRKADEKADRVDHAVVSRRVDECGHAKERRGRCVVTGDGESILPTTQPAIRSIEARRRGGAALCRPSSDAQADRDKNCEHQDGDRIDRLPRHRTYDHIGTGGGEGEAVDETTGDPCGDGRTPEEGDAHRTSSIRRSFKTSKRAFARTT